MPEKGTKGSNGRINEVFFKGNCKSGQEGFIVTSLRGTDLKIRQRLVVKEVECEADHSSHRAGFKK